MRPCYKLSLCADAAYSKTRIKRTLYSADTSLGAEIFFPFFWKSNLYLADPSIKRTRTTAWVPKFYSLIYCKSNLFQQTLLLTGRGHQNLAILLHETCIKRTFRMFLECVFIKLWNYRLI